MWLVHASMPHTRLTLLGARPPLQKQLVTRRPLCMQKVRVSPRPLPASSAASLGLIRSTDARQRHLINNSVGFQQQRQRSNTFPRRRPYLHCRVVIGFRNIWHVLHEITNDGTIAGDAWLRGMTKKPPEIRPDRELPTWKRLWLRTKLSGIAEAGLGLGALCTPAA